MLGHDDETVLFRESQPFHQNPIIRYLLPTDMVITSAIIIPLMLGPSRSQ